MATEAGKAVAVKQPRAYQIELFDVSMKQNVIVTMDTGSGKTHVAKLRIEAELERCSPEKLVWFLAPTVVLAEQQHKYLTSQLPAYQSKLICGSDNVDHWSTPTIWNAVLRNIRIVVSTSRILLDALVHAFVQIDKIALLVFDEAHHCMKGGDTNRIMQEFYHPAPVGRRPFILGLSASPITNAKPGALERLEANLNAVCKAPTRHLEELQQYVHQPKMCRLTYAEAPVPASEAMQKLEQFIHHFGPIPTKTPDMRVPTEHGRLESQMRHQNATLRASAKGLKQLEALLRRATELHDQLGQWASAFFLNACVEKLREKVARRSNMVASMETREELFLYQTLAGAVGERAQPSSEAEVFRCSSKAMSLLKYLQAEYTKDVTGIIFVKERTTATILAALISQHPITRNHYSAEPFVGTSASPRKQTLIDLADIKAQSLALADFRSGKNCYRLLVSTAVMEEGVDISAMNLVIRFDDPQNFRAFIQSRGRARMVESKFILMCNENDPSGSYSKWKDLEEQMKAKYMDEKRRIAQRVEDEEVEEECDEFLSDPSTGARLSIHDAKGHLEHFCACLPKVPYTDSPRPEYVLELQPAGTYKADCILPHSIVPARRIRGQFAWKTEAMAIKQAALKAYTYLYECGLINKNLLPTALPDPVLLGQEVEEEEESLIRVRGRMNPWTKSLEPGKSYPPHVLTVSAQLSNGVELPPLHILIPIPLGVVMDINLLWTHEQPIKVKVYPELLVNGLPQDDEFQRLCRLSSQRLFESVFVEKSEGMNEVPGFLVVPFLDAGLLRTWLNQCSGDISAENRDELRPEWGLIRLKDGSRGKGSRGKWSRGARPYIFRSKVLRVRESDKADDSMGLPKPVKEEVHFEVRRLPKQLDYRHQARSKDFNTAIDFLPADDCYIERFPTAYAQAMLLIPSVLHKIEIRKVAMILSRELLLPVKFRNFELVETAICASAANESKNYQRLELIGDSVLKFWTSINMCASFPTWHEGYLSTAKSQIVSNAHLCRAAKDQKMDEYIHAQPFANARWRPPTVWPKNGEAISSAQRDMSSKVLADVVEALIGASYLDGRDEENGDRKVKACLQTFLGSLSWKTPSQNASALHHLVPQGSLAFENFDSLTEITGFRFEKIVLLVEALTHPSHPPVSTHGSYQRLEFLGDSVLDHIVVEELARYTPELSHFKMHLIRAAIVNAPLLAFFCLRTGLERDQTAVTTNGTSGAVDIKTIKKKTHLWEFMKHSGKSDLLEAQEACVGRHEKLGSAISSALEGGKSHPWYLLLSLNAPKFFSDIIESILGAVFIDSGGNLQSCKGFLERLGFMKYLRRIMMTEDVDVMHPKQRLGIVAGNAKVRYVLDASRVVDGAVHYSSTVSIDDEPTAASKGEVGRAAAETKAAERAVQILLRKKIESGGGGSDQSSKLRIY